MQRPYPVLRYNQGIRMEGFRKWVPGAKPEIRIGAIRIKNQSHYS
jgi:hypothetical protein